MCIFKTINGINQQTEVPKTSLPTPSKSDDGNQFCQDYIQQLMSGKLPPVPTTPNAPPPALPDMTQCQSARSKCGVPGAKMPS